jgi:hypothetical protein
MHLVRHDEAEVPQIKPVGRTENKHADKPGDAWLQMCNSIAWQTYWAHSACISTVSQIVADQASG